MNWKKEYQYIKVRVELLMGIFQKMRRYKDPEQQITHNSHIFLTKIQKC